MTEVMNQHAAALTASSSRQDVVSELLDDYTYEDAYDVEDASPQSSLAPAFKELPPPPPRTDSLRDAKAEAIQRMNTKFQLREDDSSSVSSSGSRNGSIDQTPRTRITSRSLSRSGTPPSLKLFVSNGATAYIPPTPVVYPAVKPLPSSVILDSKELPPPPPERSIKRKELQTSAMGHKPSKSELERNDSFHSQKDSKGSDVGDADVAAAPSVKRKAVPESGVRKFVSLLELNNGPRGGKPAAAPTSAPRETSSGEDMGPSRIPVKQDMSADNQLPPTPPEENAVPSPPRKALVGVGLPSNPRTKQPTSPLHARGKSSTGFNILKAQRPAPPVPTIRKEVTTPEMTPSPTLKPEIRMDNEISPMKPLPPPTEHRRPLSYEGPGEQQQGSPKQKATKERSISKTDPEVEQEAEQQKDEAPQQPVAATPPALALSAQPDFPLRTTSLDPPEPSPSIRPYTAPAPQSTFTTTHPSLSSTTLPTTLPSPTPETSDPFIPLTKQPIPLRLNLIPRITPSQLHCYTSHRTHVWSNNVFQPMGCMVCHSNEKDRKFSCTWCQLRICRACSQELLMVPGRNLGALLKAREEVEGGRLRVLVEDVDEVVEEEGKMEDDEADERGRSMMKVDSRERREVLTPRE
ncbi:hypothetical protein SVAN01_01780 [Stagonosporopsis vannaccii]|nr:hypothetical protein SVAN01_01780 [Stagonosporopsis vannaccii]